MHKFLLSHTLHLLPWNIRSNGFEWLWISYQLLHFLDEKGRGGHKIFLDRRIMVFVVPLCFIFYFYCLEDCFVYFCCFFYLLDSFFYRLVWKLFIPKTIAVFIWRLSLNRLPTLDNLRKRNIMMQNLAFTCHFCQQQEKFVEHTLFTCNFASNICNQCYLWLVIVSM